MPPKQPMLGLELPDELSFHGGLPYNLREKDRDFFLCAGFDE